MASNDNTAVGGIAFTRPDAVEEPDKGTIRLIALPQDDKLYGGIVADFKKAGLKIATVERVLNYRLCEKYLAEKQTFRQDHIDLDPGFDINERYLYHGTNGDKNTFTEEEIDNRLSNPGCFGNGIYFSDNPKKCAKYAERGNNEKLILLERVLLGESKVYPRGKTDKQLKREPVKENPGRGNRRYDSVEGTPTQFREFVIYERRRALVECIITYTRDETLSAAGDASFSVISNQPPAVPVDTPSDQTVPSPADDTDTDSSDSGGEDEQENEASTSSDEDDDFDDANDKNVTSGEESDEEFHDTDRTPLSKVLAIDPEVLNAKIKEFLQKTEETDESIAKLYVVLENYNVESAVVQYNTPVSIELGEEEEAEAERMIQELEKELCIPENQENFDSLSAEEKDALMPLLVQQFCKICGLNKETPKDDTVARKHLDQTNWETDLAVLAYFEELYDL